MADLNSVYVKTLAALDEVAVARNDPQLPSALLVSVASLQAQITTLQAQKTALEQKVAAAITLLQA